MKDYFVDILDKDEQIIKVFKPNKLKLYLSTFLTVFFVNAWWALPIIFGIVFGESQEFDPVPLSSRWLIAIGLILVIFIVIFTITWILVSVYYKNVYYAYSNKRVIIRKGIFGVDFKSLDMAMIGAVNIYVSLLDKILRKNTGTITFGSTASPVVNAGGASASVYKFANITKHYETYREVKSVIDEFKAKK